MKRFTYFNISIIILLLFIFASSIIIASEEPKNKYDIELVNDTNLTYVFYLYWIDHPFLDQTHGKPWNIVSAEIAPGESFVSYSGYPPGSYIITAKERWNNDAIEFIEMYKITPGIKKITITMSIIKGKHKLTLNFDYNL